MSDIDFSADPSDYTAPPDVIAAIGSPDPNLPAVVSPNVDDRLSANEAANADLQRRISDLETL